MVCEWCGRSFTPARRPGPPPRYCRPSHRQRAYEARLKAGRRDGGQPVTVTATRLVPSDHHERVGLTPAEGSSRLEAALRGAQPAPTQLGELREAVETLMSAITNALGSHGLPVLTADDEARWALVAPVSRAVRAAAGTLTQHGRSRRQLDHAYRELVAAGLALSDPGAFAERQSGFGHRDLAIVVPGPDGAIPTGLIDCEVESGTRVVRWYPQGWSREGEPLPQVAGRPADFRYRWQDRRVWDQLALDLIILCCGWRTAPSDLPPALARSRQLLGNQLRRDISKGTWAVEPASVVRWLAHADAITVYGADPSQ